MFFKEARKLRRKDCMRDSCCRWSFFMFFVPTVYTDAFGKTMDAIKPAVDGDDYVFGSRNFEKF